MEQTKHTKKEQEILDLIKEYTYDGDHHKQWVLDQIIRIITGNKYEDWVKEYEKGEDGPKTYSWEVGIAP